MIEISFPKDRNHNVEDEECAFAIWELNINY
jgi:hypothetical protein